jgi:hypothetical protein
VFKTFFFVITVLILIKLQYNVTDIFILKKIHNSLNVRYNGHTLDPIGPLNRGFTVFDMFHFVTE